MEGEDFQSIPNYIIIPNNTKAKTKKKEKNNGRFARITIKSWIFEGPTT